MSVDFNDAPEQRDFGALIPDGTFVKLKGYIRPGTHTLPGTDQADAGLFKAAAPPSEAIMLDWEFTVMFGPHAKQKLWQLFVVSGGTVDEKGQSKAGNISKGNIRAMVESALGIDPKDMSDAAKAKRVLPNFSALDGIEFAARIGVEAGGIRPGGGDYPDKNRISHVVVPGEPEWQPVMAGQEVAAKPTGAAKARVSGAAPGNGQAQKPAWQQAAAPANASAAPAAAAEPAKPTWGNSGGVSEKPATTAAGPGWLNR